MALEQDLTPSSIATYLSFTFFPHLLSCDGLIISWRVAYSYCGEMTWKDAVVRKCFYASSCALGGIKIGTKPHEPYLVVILPLHLWLSSLCPIRFIIEFFPFPKFRNLLSDSRRCHRHAQKCPLLCNKCWSTRVQGPTISTSCISKAPSSCMDTCGSFL